MPDVLASLLFQSLFCWKFLLGYTIHYKNDKYIVFQSLFCWKFLLGEWFEPTELDHERRFNPCFAGSSS